MPKPVPPAPQAGKRPFTAKRKDTGAAVTPIRLAIKKAEEKKRPVVKVRADTAKVTPPPIPFSKRGPLGRAPGESEEAARLRFYKESGSPGEAGYWAGRVQQEQEEKIGQKRVTARNVKATLSQERGLGKWADRTINNINDLTPKAKPIGYAVRGAKDTVPDKPIVPKAAANAAVRTAKKQADDAAWDKQVAEGQKKQGAENRRKKQGI